MGWRVEGAPSSGQRLESRARAHPREKWGALTHQVGVIHAVDARLHDGGLLSVVARALTEQRRLACLHPARVRAGHDDEVRTRTPAQFDAAMDCFERD